MVTIWVVGTGWLYFLFFSLLLSISPKYSTLNDYCLCNKLKKIFFPQKNFFSPKTKERTLGWDSGVLFFSCAANYLVVWPQGITFVSKKEGLEHIGCPPSLKWNGSLRFMMGLGKLLFCFIFLSIFTVCLPRVRLWYRQMKHPSPCPHGAYNRLVNRDKLVPNHTVCQHDKCSDGNSKRRPSWVGRSQRRHLTWDLDGLKGKKKSNWRWGRDLQPMGEEHIKAKGVKITSWGTG